ncbi:hypothetical protein [Sphingomonas sp. UYP23]
MSDGGKEAIGFAGLSTFRTDIDAAFAKADRAASGPRPMRQDTSDTTTAAPVHRDTGASSGVAKKIGGWVLGIIIIIGIKGAFFGATHTSAPYEQSTETAAPAISTPQAEDTSIVPPTDGATDTAAASTDGNWQIVDQGPSAAPRPDPSAGDPTDMPKPTAYDSSTLSIGELRYCLAEDIRISAEQSELNELRSSDGERYNSNVDGINASITDYQSRCSKRSFNVSDKQMAEPQVENQRVSLEAEGRARVS